MSWLTTVLYVLFFISVIIPVYTYAIYPLILLSFHKKPYERHETYIPKVSVLVVSGNNENLTAYKQHNLQNLTYPNYEVLTCDKVNEENITVIESEQAQKTGKLNALLKAAQGEILLVTDHKTPIDSLALKCLVRHFGDKRVGCVVGQLCSDNPSAFWKYENYVRQQEGKVGRVSGANSAIYAIRRELVTNVPENIINVDFYVSTLVQQKGYDVVFESEAVAYERPGEKADHVRDGVGYYQALSVFWRMLLPGKGSFVYWSHRVLKWLTPFFLIIMLAASAILAFNSVCMTSVLCLQIIGYFCTFVFYSKTMRNTAKQNGIIMKLIMVATYFVSLNLDWLCGCFYYLTKREVKD